MVVAQQQRLLPLLHNTDYVQMSLYHSSVEITPFFDSGVPLREAYCWTLVSTEASNGDWNIRSGQKNLARTLARVPC